MGERRYSDDSTVELLERSNFQSVWASLFVDCRRIFDDRQGAIKGVNERCAFSPSFQASRRDSIRYHERLTASIFQGNKKRALSCACAQIHVICRDSTGFMWRFMIIKYVRDVSSASASWQIHTFGMKCTKFHCLNQPNRSRCECVSKLRKIRYFPIC